MSDKEFINNLSSTEADIRVLKSKIVDAKKIKLNGENLEDKFGFKQEDYPKLISRVNLPEDSNYILWTDSGNPVYISFADKLTKGYYEVDERSGLFLGNTAIKTFDIDLPKLEYAGNMFYECQNLISFTGDVSSLKYGCAENVMGGGVGMFENCKNLKVFTSSLKNLQNGYAMFIGCKLNKESVLSIVRSIKQENLYNGDTTATLSLGIDKNIISDEELLSELGITYTDGVTGYSSTITGFSGGQWNLAINFN